MAFVKRMAIWMLMGAVGAGAQVAARPPMGWNSWDAYGLTIDEVQFRANVKVEATQLKQFGWEYAVVDEGWYLENPQNRPTPDKLRYALDAYGRYVPVPERFPSAGSADEASFAALGAWVHAQGLKFGIHIVRGIPRESARRNLAVEGSSFHAADVADTGDACPWDPTNWGVRDDAAGQAWYDSLFRQYAAWGVDLVKVDCIGDHPYKVTELRMIRRAIDHVGRPMVLSVSPGPMQLEHAEEIASIAQMWRISDDIWDYWTNDAPWPRSVRSQFATTAAWARYSGPGHWPDADMLPLGELRPAPGYGDARSSRLSHAEQRTLLALWCMARSPLILGANLTMLDAWTKALVTNRRLLRIDQTAMGSRQVLERGDIVVWSADLPDGGRAVAVFNRGDSAANADLSWEDADVKRGSVEDAWTGQRLGRMARISSRLAPHDCAVWIVR